MFASDVAMILAEAGHGEQSLARVEQNLARFPTTYGHTSTRATCTASSPTGHLAKDGRQHAIALLDAHNAHDVHAVDARWTRKKRSGAGLSPETIDKQDKRQSPLSDSNRRPLPYHGTIGSARTGTSGHEWAGSASNHRRALGNAGVLACGIDCSRRHCVERGWVPVTVLLPWRIGLGGTRSRRVARARNAITGSPGPARVLVGCAARRARSVISGVCDLVGGIDEVSV